MGIAAGAVWAIDVGRAALKAMKLVSGEDADRVEDAAFDFIEYPQILGQPDADAEDLVRQALTTFRGRHRLKGCRVAVAGPGHVGLVKFIKIPPGFDRERVPGVVKFEMQQSLPFSREDAVWDYQAIGDGEEVAEVGIFLMKRENVRRAIRPLVAAGIEVDLVQMAPIALFNFLAFDMLEGAKDDRRVVHLDVGANDAALIITDGMRLWQRDVPIGGNHFTLALAKQRKLTFAEAERLKRNIDGAPDPEVIVAALRRVFDDFAREVRRSIDFFSGVNYSSRIARVVGSGGGFKLPGLKESLRQGLGYEVETLGTFQRLAGEDVTGAPRFRENLSSFAVCYDLALQGLSRAEFRTNLLPPEWRAIRGWMPGAVMARVRRLLRKSLDSRDDVLAPGAPVWWKAPESPEPPEPPVCPACRADWPSPVLDACPNCGWRRYPGADRPKWGRVGGCPRCGFSYRWDGARCFHCHLGTAEPTGQDASGSVGEA